MLTRNTLKNVNPFMPSFCWDGKAVELYYYTKSKNGNVRLEISHTKELHNALLSLRGLKLNSDAHLFAICCLIRELIKSIGGKKYAKFSPGVKRLTQLPWFHLSSIHLPTNEIIPIFLKEMIMRSLAFI